MTRKTLRRLDATEADTLKAICDLLDVMQVQGKLLWLRHSPSNVIISWNLIKEILWSLFYQRIGVGTAFDKIKSSCFRSPRESQLGAADVIVFQLMNGHPDVLCIEVKSPTGTQAKAQKKWQKMAEAQGMRYLIARSLDDVMEVLR